MPVPVPPVVVRVTDVPRTLVKVKFEIDNVAWLVNANTKLLVAELAALKPTLSALVAVTSQVVSAEEFKVLPLTEQPVPVAVKVTAPVPEPPVVVRVNGEPGVFVSAVLEIVNVA